MVETHEEDDIEHPTVVLDEISSRPMKKSRSKELLENAAKEQTIVHPPQMVSSNSATSIVVLEPVLMPATPEPKRKEL